MAGKKFQKSTNRGSIMVLVLFAIVLLLLSGAGVLSIGQTARISSIRTATEIAAFSAADAGITKAIWAINTELQTGGTWDELYLEEELRTKLPNSDATYSFLTTRAMDYYGDTIPAGYEDLIDFVRSASWKDGDYVVRSLGACGAARKVIYAIVGLEGPCDAGVLVRDRIELKAGTRIDGGDSRVSRDPHDSTGLDVEVEIGTLSTAPDNVILSNGVFIDGNVLVGVGGDPGTVIKDLGAETGIRYSMMEEPDLPLIYPPTGLMDWGVAIEAKGNPPVYFTAANSGMYTGIDLAQTGLDDPGILVIESGDVVLHITGDINMGVRCEIIIREGATLNLYIDGDIRPDTDAGFNNEGFPPDLKIWGNWRGGEVEQNWQLNARTTCLGQIYAPAANLTVNNSGDLFGAFIANSFLMMNDGNLFYDGALRDVSSDDEGVRFVLKRWCE